MSAAFEAAGEGRYRVSGTLDFDSVPVLWSASRQAFSGGGELEIDLGGVRRADSAALALLLEWLRSARRHGATLRLRHLPEQLFAIAHAGGIDTLLSEAAADR